MDDDAEAAAIGSSDVTNERGAREAGRPSRLLTGRGPLAAKGLLPPRLAHGETEAQWGEATAQGHTGAQSDQDTTLLSHPRPSGTICLAGVSGPPSSGFPGARRGRTWRYPGR